MRQRSDTWVRLAARGNFRMESIAIINGVEYTAISAPIINRALLTDNLSVGNCISATLKLSILTDDKIGKAAKIVIKARITDDVEYSEWLEFGTFYIDTRAVDSGLVTVQCYDSMLKASQTYGDETNPEDRIGWPKTMDTCVREIAARIGVEIDPRTVIKTTAPYQVPYPNKMSMMQVLGYIGACHGGNWIITPENKLRLVPLLSPPAETFDIIDHYYRKIYTGDGHKLVWKHTDNVETVEHRAGGGLVNVPVVIGKISTSRAFTVTRVILARDEDLGYALGDDTGYTLIIESNPYACQAICDDLFEELNGLEYYPYTITSACYDPAAELGDWILVGDKVRSVLYSENATLNVDYRVTATAPGKDEVGSEYPYLTSIQRIQMEQEQIKKYTETEKDEIYSKIEQTHTEIIIQVAGTYATKDAVSSDLNLLAGEIVAEVERATAAEEQLSSQLKLTEDKITAQVTKVVESNEEMQSSLTIALQDINMKVSKGDVSSQISIETGKVTIGSNRLVIDSDNFKLSGTGEIEARGSVTSLFGPYKTSLAYGGILFYTDDAVTGEFRSDRFVFPEAPYGDYYIPVITTMDAGIAITEHKYDPEICLDPGYLFNNGMDPSGYTERNIFFSDVRLGKSAELYTKLVNLSYGSDSAEATLIYSESSDGGVGAQFWGNFSVDGDFRCWGEKNRLVNTENYGVIKMNAMESSSAVFSDIGSAVIDDSGVSYVFFDERFMEVIELDCDYQVFITDTSEKKTTYVTKHDDYFVVHGAAGAKFDWIVYARQKDYAHNYMDVMDEEHVEYESVKETHFYGDDNAANQSQKYMDEFADTYDQQAEAYLKQYELEVTNYGN